MSKKQLPLSSNASITKGSWMVFNSDKLIIRVWMSMLNGKEIIYVNEDKVFEKINISSFNTVDSFDHKGNHFDVEIDTESLAPIRINCSVFVNGQFIGCQLLMQETSGAMTVTNEDSQKSQQRMFERYLNLGKKELADYDLDHAALHFEKACMIDETNPEIYYFKACILSLNEETDQAFEHLEKSINLGLTGKNRILDEDHFAFIRVTDRFEEFRIKYLK